LIVKWPFAERVDAGNVWGLTAVSTAFLVGIPTVAVAIHGAGRGVNPWWPTDWMALPLIGFVAGIMLLVVPVRRARSGTQAPAIPVGTKVTGEVDVQELSGDAAGIRVAEAKSGVVLNGKARVGKASKRSRITGTDINKLG